MSKRDCEHCKHYIWDLDRKYRSCESWECEYEVEDVKKKTDILQEVVSGDN